MIVNPKVGVLAKGEIAAGSQQRLGGELEEVVLLKF